MTQDLSDLRIRIDRSAGSDGVGAGLDRLERLVLAGAVDEAAELCRALTPGGALPSARLIPLIRRFEAGWQTDAIDFASLSMAFVTLHRLFIALTAAPGAEPGRGRVLLATVPGEAHHFGTLILAEELRAAGWRAETLLAADAGGLCDRVAETSFDMIGLSVGHDEALEGLVDLVADLRAASKAPGARVVLGGAAFAGPLDQYGFLRADRVLLSPAATVSYLVQTFRNAGN